MFIIYQVGRITLVIALIIVAAILSTPKGRLPLALRGVLKILRKDRGLEASETTIQSVSGWKRLLAFLVTVLAAFLAVCSL